MELSRVLQSQSPCEVLDLNQVLTSQYEITQILTLYCSDDGS
jgi:hypothetical protein